MASFFSLVVGALQLANCSSRSKFVTGATDGASMRPTLAALPPGGSSTAETGFTYCCVRNVPGSAETLNRGG